MSSILEMLKNIEAEKKVLGVIHDTPPTRAAVDLTASSPPPQSSSSSSTSHNKKRPIIEVTPRAAPTLNSGITTGTTVQKPSKQARVVAKKETAHALLWICAAGKGQGRQWKAKALKVIGVYASKAAAEAKKEDIMSRHTCCGHGDIVVGGTWEDEIDLVVRPCEEVAL